MSWGRGGGEEAIAVVIASPGHGRPGYGRGGASLGLQQPREAAVPLQQQSVLGSG
jgi:hypothetical protein